MEISAGICAYNEEKNIGKVLDALLSQKLNHHRIKEILVVSSGSTDKTNDIVRSYEKKGKCVRLITQEKKEGKASAVNLFLKEAKGDILLLISADVIPESNTLEVISEPFSNPAVGLVSGRPIPDNDPETFMGFVVNLIWDLHHKLQLKSPKGNEILAIRPVVKSIDKRTAVDDLQIEAMVKMKGYSLVYAPEAVVINHGPESISDLIKQRRRIITGYLHTKQTRGYYPVTMDKIAVLSALLDNIYFSPKKILWTMGAVALELYIRIRANVDYYILKKNPYNWDIAKSTKKLK